MTSLPSGTSTYPVYSILRSATSVATSLPHPTACTNFPPADDPVESSRQGLLQVDPIIITSTHMLAFPLLPQFAKNFVYQRIDSYLFHL